MMKKYISNEILDHGLGSKILKIINLIGYTLYLKSIGHDVEFVYTPLGYEGYGKNFQLNQLFLYWPHKIKNLRLDYIELCERWESMINYKGLKSYDVNVEDIEFLIHPALSGETSEIIFNEIRKRKNEIIDLLSLPKKTKEKECVSISIHIRRGDVNKNSHLDRFSDDSYYLEIIDILKKKYEDKCEITIYSQRNGFNISNFKDYNIIFDDESLDNEIWLKLFHSDILVMSKSAFSYSAGMLSNGIVIYEDMFHPKLYDWIYKKDIENL